MGERICVLKDGTIQQVDTPTALYERPANAFVAGFIGSPEMNLREATVESRGAGFVLVVGGVVLPLPEDKAARLRTRIGQKVKLGLRPEHVTAGGKKDVPVVEVEGALRFVEHMGSEVFVHFDVGGVPFTSRVPADQLCGVDRKQRGETHRFGFQMGQCHAFDNDSGANLLL